LWRILHIFAYSTFSAGQSAMYSFEKFVQENKITLCYA
jgi:hypothetical protein